MSAVGDGRGMSSYEIGRILDSSFANTDAMIGTIHPSGKSNERQSLY
jgi:hypothetical protein